MIRSHVQISSKFALKKIVPYDDFEQVILVFRLVQNDLFKVSTWNDFFQKTNLDEIWTWSLRNFDILSSIPG